MPRDVSGNFSLPSGTIVANGDTILPSQHNPAMQDIASALSNSLARNGNGQMLADLNLGGFRVLNAATVSAGTPNNGTTGGLQLRANAETALAIFQVTDAGVGGQYGYWQYTAAGQAQWSGKIVSGAGLQVNGGTIYEGPNAVWHAGNLNPADKQNALGFTPANKAGDTFTGDVVVQGVADVRTPNDGSTGGLRLRGNAVSGHAYLQVTDAGVTAEWGFFEFASGSAVWNGSFNALGALTQNGQQVYHTGNFNPATKQNALGFTPANKAGDTFTGPIKRDAQFFMEYTSNPILNFDAGDYIAYERGSDKYLFFIGGNIVASIDGAANLRVAGNIYANTAP